MTDRPAVFGDTHLKAAVFDLDGTLVDSAGAITTAVNEIMAAVGASPYEVKQVATFIGDGPDTVLKRAMARRGLEVSEQDSRRFSKLYQDCSVSQSEIYPDILAALDELRIRGYRLAVCTNKPGQATRSLLGRLQIDWMFDAVCCSDECTHRKPHPAHLFETLQRLPARPCGAVMIGDHRNDILAANACGLPAVLAQWGETVPEAAPDLAGCEVACRTREPRELPDILDRLLGREDGVGA
ncbi:HAD-IIIA family hydrolase [Rhodobacterales bacterium]|nr:HAD-IIIA family hydrolase [Rhodobacterales bacterium]